MNLLSKSGYCMPFEERNGQVQSHWATGNRHIHSPVRNFSIMAWISRQTATCLQHWLTELSAVSEALQHTGYTKLSVTENMK